MLNLFLQLLKDKLILRQIVTSVSKKKLTKAVFYLFYLLAVGSILKLLYTDFKETNNLVIFSLRNVFLQWLTDLHLLRQIFTAVKPTKVDQNICAICQFKRCV